jgi:hypothetical protein
MQRMVSMGVSTPRDPKFQAIDASALYAVAQAAVNVELFTIPLYMGTLYSVQGMHQITAPARSRGRSRRSPQTSLSSNARAPKSTERAAWSRRRRIMRSMRSS